MQEREEASQKDVYRGTVHKHLWGLMQKGRSLNLLALVRVGLKKYKFSNENWIYSLFYGVDSQFSWLNGYLFRSEGGEKFCNIFSSHYPPPLPYISICERPFLSVSKIGRFVLMDKAIYVCTNPQYSKQNTKV